MARTSNVAFCALLCLVAGAHATSIFTLNWVQIPIEPEKGFIFSMALNPAVNNSALSNPNPFDASVVKVNLPPCGVRTMHIHRNCDELHYITLGTFAAGTALPNGTVVTDTVVAGQSFIAPANYVHSLSNPSCTERSEFLGFYNRFDAAITNIPAAAYNMPGGPFKPYVDAAMDESLQHSQGVFAFDPVCLARCGLGPKGGQEPCDPAVPAPKPACDDTTTESACPKA